MADYNIAMGVKQPEPVNYLGQMAQVMGIKALQDEMQGSEGVRAAIQSGMSPTDAKLLQFGKRGEAVYKAGLAGEKESLAATGARRTLIAQVMKNVADVGTIDAAQAGISRLAQEGVLTSTQAQHYLDQAAKNPDKIRDFAMSEYAMAISPEKLMPHLMQQDRGGTQAVLAANPLTGAVTTTSETNKTISPDAAAQVGATIRGQDLTRMTASERLAFDKAKGHIIAGEGEFINFDPYGNARRVSNYETQFGPNAPIDQRSADVLGANAAAPGSANALLTGGGGRAAPVLNNLNPAAQATGAGPTVAAANAAATQQNAPRPANARGLTEVQAKSTGFANRAAQAHAIINAVGAGGEVQPGLLKRSLEAIPLIGEGLGTMANITQSDAEQQVEQAQRNFVNAILRQESGAAVNQSEFDNARKQYFPQPGDGPKVIEQKRQNREMAIKSLEIAAGPGVKKAKGGATDDPLGLR